MRRHRPWFLVLLSAGVLALSACGAAASSEDDPRGASSEGDPKGDALVAPQATTLEDFESASKTAYAAADVSLASGTWNLNDALIGTLSGDVKDGAQAARIHNSGTVTMGFDRASAGTVTIKHATYGTDANGSWGLFYSRDQGSTWTQVGSAVTTAANSLASATFAVNQSGNVRLQVRKLDGGTNRLDVDDISIGDFAGGGTDAGTGGGSSSGGAKVSVHTTLGLPSAATTSNLNNYLSVKSQYVVAYNSSRKIPNWVSWELNTSYIGSESRADDFRPDDTLPSSMPQASLADYSGSGFDRGHMCPSGDRTLNLTANQMTFYLSNMIPQSANNNRGPWEKFEAYCRTLASQGKELFIVSGGVVTSGSGTIGSGVVVPDSTFKVVAVLNQVGQGPANVTSSTRVISIVIPNDDTKVSESADWTGFRVTARSIEQATNLNFLSDVAQSVQDVVETRVDNQ